MPWGGPLDPGRIYSFKTRNPTDDFIPRGTIVKRGRRILGVITDDPGKPGRPVMLCVWGEAYARLGDGYGPVKRFDKLSFGHVLAPTRPDGLTPVFVDLLGRNSAKGLIL